MAHYMAINKSGKNLPIFSGWPSVDKGNQIGTIYNREAFASVDKGIHNKTTKYGLPTY